VRYRARVEYDGTEFAGFQVQPGRRTVQGEIERVLAHLDGGRHVRIAGAGRTDAGVHAAGQVIAFTWTGRLRARRLGDAIGALLPRDIAIGPLVRVDPDFSPRRAASRRTYRYSIWNGPRSPLRERYALGLRERLDVEAMQAAADELVGRHDLSAFGRVVGHGVRNLHEVRVRRQGHLVTVDVVGDAFLRQMVRSIVGALVRVGQGSARTSDVTDALRQPGERAFAGNVAPPHGLCLTRVTLGRRGTRSTTAERNGGQEEETAGR
jgi:tRNA pseudouridine38-40 synthase